MSSPTGIMQIEGSFHGSLRYAVAKDVQDTTMFVAGVPATSENVAEAIAMSAFGGHTMLGSTATVLSNSPNAVFQRSQSRGRSRSVSLILRCVRSLVGLFVAQRRA